MILGLTYAAAILAMISALLNVVAIVQSHMELVDAAGEFTYLRGFRKAPVKGWHYDLFVIFVEIVLFGGPVLLVSATCLFLLHEVGGFEKWVWVLIVLLCVSVLYRLVILFITICGVGTSVDEKYPAPSRSTMAKLARAHHTMAMG